jgi:CBS domain-containing protein
MSIGRIAIREVHLADVHDSVIDAARRMRERGVGALVVLDAERRPIGIVTDRDLVTRVLATTTDPHEMRVAAIMTREPQVVADDAPIENALARMRQGRHRRLLVVDDAGRLVGVVSVDDVLALLGTESYRLGDIVGRPTP